jgi:hypothetical protein
VVCLTGYGSARSPMSRLTELDGYQNVGSPHSKVTRLPTVIWLRIRRPRVESHANSSMTKLQLIRSTYS